MQPRIKVGLIAGAIGLVINMVVAAALGICGPFVAALTGAVAGFITAQQEKASTQGEGARAGAVSGGVAGALVFVGQLIGAVAALALIQFSGAPTIFGSAPAPNDPAAQQVLYYLSGLITGACFGTIGIGLAAGAGALVAFLATSPQPPAPPIAPNAPPPGPGAWPSA